MKTKAAQCPLAVFAPQVGVLSETFIRRHMEDLLPGKTVVTAGSVADSAHWNASNPTVVLNRIPFQWRALEAVTRTCGRKGVARTAFVRRRLRAHGVQVVLGQYMDYSLRWLQECRRLGLRFFAHAHGYDVSRQLRHLAWREKYLEYNDSDGVITISRCSRDRLVGLGLKSEKVHVIPSGVDVPFEPLRRPHGAGSRCLAVGRFTGKKAPILVLGAFHRALKSRPDLFLDYVGTGNLLPAAKKYVGEHGLEDRIMLHGGRSHAAVLDLMKSADIFLQHSIIDPDTGDEEGLPVAILEAMAHALPVVSTRHAGIPEAVVEGETGYLVDEGDHAGMAERILVLANNGDDRQRMGHAGWRRARDRFSWERERTELLRVLGLSNLAA